MKVCFAKTAALACLIATAAIAAAPEGLWIDVPYVKQERNGCGAACIAMVMEYWNRGRDPNPAAAPETIYHALDNPGSRGIYASQMEQYFRRHGFQTFAFRGTQADLEHHLKNGRPLIVCLGPRGRDSELHFVVVAGLDPARDTVLVNDPARRKLLEMDGTRFRRAWAAMRNWTLLAVPN